MRSLEQFCITLRHRNRLEGADWLWDFLRPVYNKVVALAGRKGLERIINGTDSVLVAPEFRQILASYEPNVWAQVMSDVRRGDVVADVGAYVGIYSVALAQRVERSGRVFAFEPHAKSFRALEAHCTLNGVLNIVTLVPKAVSERDGVVRFIDEGEMQSHIDDTAELGPATVSCIRLDSVFATSRLDILKIDVEGYEEKVLRGAVELLRDARRSPRSIYVEVHPYAWAGIGSTSESLLGLLGACNYEVVDIRGQPVKLIDFYGEIVARKRPNPS